MWRKERPVTEYVVFKAAQRRKEAGMEENLKDGLDFNEQRSTWQERET